MLRKIRLKSARTTRPMLEVVPGAPVVTWNTGSIEQVTTRKETAARAVWQETALIVGCILLAALIVGLLVLGLWLAGRYAML